MKEYPQSFHAMDLVAEHRLRALHSSWAFIHKAEPSLKPALPGHQVRMGCAVCLHWHADAAGSAPMVHLQVCQDAGGCSSPR